MIARREPSPLARTTTGFLFVAIVCWIFADIAISTSDPWREFGLLLKGIVTPDFYATNSWAWHLPTRLRLRCLASHWPTSLGSASRLYFIAGLFGSAVLYSLDP